MRWVFHLVCIAFLEVMWSVTAGIPSVYYIESSNVNFFMAEKMTINRQRATHVLKDSSICKCRQSCIALGKNCNAWSLVNHVDNGLDCLLANEGPETIVPYSQNQSTYFFKQSSINGNYSFQADNLMYVELAELLHHQAAKERCSGIPGHRLIIIKKGTTLDYFKSIMYPGLEKPWPLTDLRKINSTYFEWGDGTSFHATEIASDASAISVYTDTADVFAGTDGFPLNDVVDSGGGPFRIVCQTNPHGVDW